MPKGFPIFVMSTRDVLAESRTSITAEIHFIVFSFGFTSTFIIEIL